MGLSSPFLTRCRGAPDCPQRRLPLAGSLASALGGSVGGLAYVFFGKPALNIAVGLLLGAIGGAIVGAAAARYAATRG